MKTRPKRLSWLAAFLALVVAAFPLQIMALYGHPPSEWLEIAAKLTPLNWAVIGLSGFCAWLALRASPWLLALLPATIAVVFLNNWAVAQAGTDYSASSAWLGSIAFFAATGFMLDRQSMSVLLNPRLRWWRTPERKRLALPVRLKVFTRRSPQKWLEGYDEFRIRTHDISEGGAFIPLAQDEGDQEQSAAFAEIGKDLVVGTQCYVCLPLKDVGFIQCRAEVVRNTRGAGGYPAGIGIRFLGLTHAEKRGLLRCLDAMIALDAADDEGAEGAASDDKASGGSMDAAA